MCRLASVLDSIVWHRELRPVAGGSCQVSVESACLSFCSGLSSGNGGAASASTNFIWSNVWRTRMSQDSLSSCWGCLRWLHFSPTPCTSASESGYQVSYLLSQVCCSPWQGEDDHAGTSLLASHLYVSGHVGERRSLMGSPLRQASMQEQSPHQMWPGSRNQTRIKACAMGRSLHADKQQLAGGTQAHSWSQPAKQLCAILQKMACALSLRTPWGQSPAGK